MQRNPKDETSKAVKYLNDGEMFEGLMNMPGWKDVYIPHLNHAIEVADHAVHDHRLKDDSMKERNAYYRGLLAALKLIDKIIQEKKWGELYIKDHHIIV